MLWWPKIQRAWDNGYAIRSEEIWERFLPIQKKYNNTWNCRPTYLNKYIYVSLFKSIDSFIYRRNMHTVKNKWAHVFAAERLRSLKVMKREVMNSVESSVLFASFQLRPAYVTGNWECSLSQCSLLFSSVADCEIPLWGGRNRRLHFCVPHVLPCWWFVSTICPRPEGNLVYCLPTFLVRQFQCLFLYPWHSLSYCVPAVNLSSLLTRVETRSPA